MKVVCVPDIHGSIHYKKIVNNKELTEQVDKIIFLGDYFDNWTNKWPSQMENFKQIIRFKKKYPEKVCLCWANHDISYYLDERCSGYQYDHAIDIEEVFKAFKNLFEVVYIFDNWIFSHAGVSNIWLKNCGIKDDPNKINQLFKEKPNFFRWVGPSGDGDNIEEGPLWIRPKALQLSAIEGYDFVIGHTEFKDSPVEVKNNNSTFLYIDSPKHDKVILLDTITKKWELI